MVNIHILESSQSFSYLILTTHIERVLTTHIERVVVGKMSFYSTAAAPEARKNLNHLISCSISHDK